MWKRAIWNCATWCRVGTVAWLLLLWGFTFVEAEGAGDAHPLAGATIVVYNTNFSESESLARFYAEQRGIPQDNLIGLDCPVEEEISREDYEARIAAPLSAELVRRGFWVARGREVSSSRVRYMALIRGMPLKIRTTLEPPKEGESRHPVNDRDEASVDQELALLGVNQPTFGAVTNPYFRSFTRAVDAGLPPGMLLVCRLDGPSDAVVRRMIRDSIRAERRGLWGWAYVDLRGLTAGPYLEGDKWLQGAVESMRRQGIPVITDRVEETWPTGFPVREAAIYYGWYAGRANGPFIEDTLQFMPGAVTLHIHSFSASTLRNPSAAWVAPLLARGAAASIGNVYEPYLSLTVHVDILQDRLMGGLSLADAAYAATPVLSWMGIVAGDPLYSPYAIWTRIDVNRRDRSNEYEQFRNTVRARNGNMSAAAPFLLALGQNLHNPMPAQAVGIWQFERADTVGAEKSLREARKLANQPWQKVQIDWFLIRVLEARGQKEAARQVILDAFREDLPPSLQALLAREQDRLFPRPTPTPIGR
jgi:uncharacterized protein (TIGR03790 family)